MTRPLAELLDTDDPAWPLVQQWIAQANKPVEVLPPAANAAEELHATQVTLRSPMGAIVYHTGGLLIDGGWIRFLGSGHPRLPRSLMGWNHTRTFQRLGEAMGFLLIADDAIGGFFAANGGALGDDVKSVYYFAPDTLRWESTGKGYSDFLSFCLGGDLDAYYGEYRWPGWRDDIATLGGDQIVSLYAPLWTAEGKVPAKSSRRPIPVAEAYALYVIELPRQLGP
jgi:hypothetical protein